MKKNYDHVANAVKKNMNVVKMLTASKQLSQCGANAQLIEPIAMTPFLVASVNICCQAMIILESIIVPSNINMNLLSQC